MTPFAPRLLLPVSSPEIKGGLGKVKGHHWPLPGQTQPTGLLHRVLALPLKDKESLRTYLRWRRLKKPNTVQCVTLDQICTEGEVCYKGRHSVVRQNWSADGRSQNCTIVKFPGVANSTTDTSRNLLCYRKYL